MTEKTDDPSHQNICDQQHSTAEQRAKSNYQVVAGTDLFFYCGHWQFTGFWFSGTDGGFLKDADLKLVVGEMRCALEDKGFTCLREICVLLTAG